MRMNNTIKMAFPLGGFFISGALVTFLCQIGFPKWVAFLFGFLGFLMTGGLFYLKLVYLTLPRDLWILTKYYRVIRNVQCSMKKNFHISDHFHATVRKYPYKVAILFEDRKITFKELDDLSNKIANLLHETTDLERGDTMAIFMENCPEFIAVYLALSKIGVVGALIGHYLRGKCLAHCIHIGHCSGIFFSCALSSAMLEVLPKFDLSMSQMLYSIGGESFIPGAISLDDAIKTASPKTLPPVQGKSIHDLACYIYTSGTTGFPKAYRIMHSRFFGLQNYFTVFCKIRHEDVVYLALPLYHSNAGILGAGQMIFSGATIAIRRKFSADEFWMDCRKYHCTICFYIGAICRNLLSQPKHLVDTQHGIRLMIGNGLDEQIWLKFIKRFQIPRIIEFYCTTEVNMSLINPFNKVGACGCLSVIMSPLNSMVLLKVNPKSKRYFVDKRGFCIQAGINDPGELVTHMHKNLAVKCYSDTEASKRKVMTNVFSKGDKYFRSGDIFRMDEEGFLYFCDRMGDAFHCSDHMGDTFRLKEEKVSNLEVESIITNLLQLRDVVVYKVKVPGSVGRARMAAIEGTKDTVEMSSLARLLFLYLPAYAVPLFVRLVPSAELTGTFKMKLKKEALDISLSDSLFVLDTSRKIYLSLTDKLYHQILDGKLGVV